MQSQAGMAAREVDELLGGMPAATADEVGAALIEFNDDFIGLAGRSFHHAQAAFEIGIQIESFGWRETAAAKPRLNKARQGKGADNALADVVSNQVPTIIETDDMVRLQPARDDPGLAPVAVPELEFAPVGDGPGDGVECGAVAILRSQWSKGNGLAQIGDGVAFLIIELAGQLFESLTERLFERCPWVLSERFMGDQDREQIGIREGGLGQASDRFSVMETKPARIVSDGKVTFLFEEVEVTSNGARSDPEASGHGAQVGVIAGADQIVDLAETIPGGTAVIHKVVEG